MIDKDTITIEHDEPAVKFYGLCNSDHNPIDRLRMFGRDRIAAGTLIAGVAHGETGDLNYAKSINGRDTW